MDAETARTAPAGDRRTARISSDFRFRRVLDWHRPAS